MPDFPANLNLSSLDGTTGFQMSGEGFGDFFGSSVSSAGDVNGDGFDDVIVGAPYADPNGDRSGASYVVFGKAGGFGANIDLSSLDGAGGFQISGEAVGDFSGRSVSSAGDVNGDGFDDVIVGADRADPNGNGSGASYVVFGKAGSFASNLNLSSLNGSNGFQISGEGPSDFSGRSVSSAGDINGDGFDDLIVGAPFAGMNGTSSGVSWVVFGKAGGFGANLNLSSLNGANGFQINGEAALDFFGSSVSSAGDVNGDGFDDLIVGAPEGDPNGGASGVSYVVFGKAGGFGANLNPSSLDGTNGFQISGEADGDFSGTSVSSAGDVNGDGLDDVIVGADRADPNGTYSGASYVVFGKAGGFGANIDLSSLDGANGFRISGEAPVDTFGISVSSAGDVNGDGFDDVIVGADRSDPNGSYSGASYVVFGKVGGFGASLDLSSLNGTNGFQIDGEVADDRSGRSVSSAGDVNGDGFDDLVVGAHQADPNGTDSGASYVIFGRAPTEAVSRTGTNADNTISGGDFDDTLIGLGGNDVLRGNGGADNMFGGLGDDTFIVESAADRVFESAGQGSDRVSSHVSFVLAGGHSIETLALASAASTEALNLTGNEFGQRLLGNAGANLLDGGGGGDRLYGFGGNDTYHVDTTDDRVFELANAGNDRVEASVSYALASGQSIETLALAEADGTASLNLVGNELGQRLLGNAGANILDGRGGADFHYGLAGNDTYRIDNVSDLVVELAGEGNDRVEASVSYRLASGQSIETLALADPSGTAALNLTGNELGQRLLGNAGGNLIDGGAGSDILYGFGGADTFRFSTALGTGNIDRIMDFAVPRDTIQLDRTIFSSLDLGTLSASAFKDIGDPGAVVDADDRILYNDATGALFYDANGSAAGGRIQFAVLDNHPATLTNADFFVVA